MAGGLLQYSGLLTKTRAMHGRLLKRKDFERILEFQNVPETIAFLREQESYSKIYAGHEEIQHRGQVEALIHRSIREDYKSLFLFANPMQRRALRLYEPQLQYQDSVPALEVSYFTWVWKKAAKISKQQMRRVLQEIFGTQADWLNIMWMYRGKRFFEQKPEELYDMLIPVHYRLRKQELHRLLQAEKVQDFLKILSDTAYFKGKEALVKMEDELSYYEVMGKMYRRLCQRYPVSIAPVYRYLYEKEQEIEHLTTALEGIRYQVPAGDIRSLVLAGEEKDGREIR